MAHRQVQCPSCEKDTAYEERKPQTLINPCFLITVLVWAITCALPIEYKGVPTLSVIAYMCLTIQLLRGLKSPNSQRCSHCGFCWEELPEWKA